MLWQLIMVAICSGVVEGGWWLMPMWGLKVRRRESRGERVKPLLLDRELLGVDMS